VSRPALRTAGAGLAVSLLAIVLQLPTYDRTLSMLDEGHMLQFADLIGRGGVLYRDANSIALPGAFDLLAVGFALFEPSILVARCLLVLEFALFASVVHLLLRRLAGPATTWAGVALLFAYRLLAFPHWQMYSYSTTAQLWLACALYAMLRYQDREDRVGLVAAGSFCGLAIVCKQDYGAAGLLALNAALWLSLARRGGPERPHPALRLACFNGPVLVLLLAVALRALSQGALQSMLDQTLRQHFARMATGVYSGLPPLLPLFGQTPLLRSAYGLAAYAPSILVTLDWPRIAASHWYRETCLWDLGIKLFFYAPYAIVAAAAARAWRQRGALHDPARRSAYLGETTLAMFAAAAILALNRPIDAVHVGVLYWSPLLLLLLWLRQVALARPRAARSLALAALLFGLATAVYAGHLVWQLHRQFDTPLASARAGVKVRSDEAAVVDAVIAYMRSETAPGERVAVLPYFPLLSFLAERDAPDGELYTFWPVDPDPQREARAIQALTTRAADVAIYHFTQWPQLPDMRRFAPAVFDYLVDHWQMERVFSDPGWGYMLAGLRRSRGPEPGRPLYSAGDPVDVFVEEPGAGLRAVSGAARARMFSSTRWPFRPVLALRPSPAERRSVLALSTEIGKQTELRTAIGVDPRRWFAYPPAWVAFGIRVVVGGERVTLFERRLDPQQHAADRGWTEVALDLSRYAGRQITLELTAQCEAPSGARLEMGGFALPRLVAP
jgi:hypothetical protein